MTSNGRMNSEYSIGNDLEGSGRGLIEVLSWHVTGGAEREHEESQVRITSVLTEIQTESF
jgi:hypothetical protein